jgi:LmbE family N-acetylglucosaminyl deacetylase
MELTIGKRFKALAQNHIMHELPRDQRVLFLCAHPDDDTFSSGAAIREMSRLGNRVTCAYLTNSPRGVPGNQADEQKSAIRKAEAREACGVVGSRPVFLDLRKEDLGSRQALDAVTELLSKEKPDVAFLPHPGESHPTHRLASSLVLKALESYPVKQRWLWESWSPLHTPNFIFFFGEDAMEVKRKAMRKHASQLSRIDELEATVAFNRWRGIMGAEMMGGYAGSYRGPKYGEAFLVSP